MGTAANASEAQRLYRQAIATAPYEAYATAPFLALHWLRLRLVLAPALRLLSALLLVCGGGRPVRGAVPPAVQVQPHAPPGVGVQWDSLLIVAMIGVLTLVLWRRRQLQQRATESPPPAEAPPAAAAAAAAVAEIGRTQGTDYAAAHQHT